MTEQESLAIEQELAAARPALERGWALLIGVPGPIFAGALGLLVLLRTGMLLNGQYRMEECVRAFPRVGASFRCQAILVSALPASLHVETERSWLLLHLTLSAAVVLVCVGMAKVRARSLGQFRAMTVWVALSSLPGVLLQSDVHYDAYGLLGGSILGFANHPATAALGGLLFGLSHPEQALIAAAIWVIMLRVLSVAGPSIQRWGIAGAGVGAALTKAYALATGASSAGRWEHLTETLGRSVANALKTGSLGVFACHGLSWLLILTWLFTSSTLLKTRVLTTLALIVLPGVVTLVTLDGTRVFVGTVWPAFLAFVCHVSGESPKEFRPFPLRTLTVVACVLALTMPGYVTHGSSIARPMLRSLFQHSR